MQPPVLARPPEVRAGVGLIPPPLLYVAIRYSIVYRAVSPATRSVRVPAVRTGVCGTRPLTAPLYNPSLPAAPPTFVFPDADMERSSAPNGWHLSTPILRVPYELAPALSERSVSAQANNAALRPTTIKRTPSATTARPHSSSIRARRDDWPAAICFASIRSNMMPGRT